MRSARGLFTAGFGVICFTLLAACSGDDAPDGTSDEPDQMTLKSHDMDRQVSDAEARSR